MGACKTAAFLCAMVAIGAQGASFTPGNLVVYRIGVPGGSTLVATGNPVFLDEYALSPSGTTAARQSIALPTTANSSTMPLVASGTATTDGSLTRSADACLAVTGYGRDRHHHRQPDVRPEFRVVAKVAANATIDTTTAHRRRGRAATATNFAARPAPIAPASDCRKRRGHPLRDARRNTSADPSRGLPQYPRRVDLW